MEFQFKERYSVDDLVVIMRMLRGENGCAWDRAQDHHSIRNNFLEEVYEAIEAIDNEDSVLLREELGDVLLQVVFHSAMEEEEGRFDFDDVANDICQKLVVRHPHVFGDVKADNAEDALKSWDAAKAQTKGQKTNSEKLLSVAKTLPALMRSQKVQGRAKKAGMDFESLSKTIENLKGEIEELENAIALGNAEQIKDEMGDVLFSAVNVSRFLDIEAEQALSDSCDKFVDRFTRVEEKLDRPMSEYSMAELDEVWKQIKK